MGVNEYTKKESYTESSHLRMQPGCRQEEGRLTKETRNGGEMHGGAEEKACMVEGATQGRDIEEERKSIQAARGLLKRE